ncbi:hypothetical protein OIU79_001964 [Salix purpurea]|uniref:Uncharacterized protein n=1 Tax=Salix purpurea TaxID=77065 RepID=A0A9Q0UR02_SALPP|nr:hypothetical protein OIU79_001964 [Salix purpurea]
MPGKLQELINRINMSGEERITGIITDWTMGWSLEVAEKMNIRRAISFGLPQLPYYALCLVFQKDSTCLKWLEPTQLFTLHSVALPFLTKHNFKSWLYVLWVVRPDITEEINEAYPEGFQERVAARGQIVGWAPQQKVLTHPSVSCFLSHCGWNSTMEGVSN